ncbi:DNA glycosylase [Myxozyma melibiosi]|uniref:DNA glycosylase n=1 Tax=Myxozyma melibiosi TaxID=54550 RepID=A0ABR1FD34_9ASCO
MAPSSFSYPTPSSAASARLRGLRERWLKLYDLVVEMRRRFPAPVDSMGCHVLPDYVKQSQSIASQNLQILISLLLSSQTKDQHTFAAVQALRDHLHPDEITPARICSLDDKVLDTLIHGVGFHAKKTVYMKKIAEMLLPGRGLNERIPTDLNTLVKTFPGIGPKMGILYLQNAQPYPGDASEDNEDSKSDKKESEQDFGLAVDTHVLRLSQQFGLVFPPSSFRNTSKEVTPEIARVQIEEIVPKEHWKEANPLLVGFGQTICGARSKLCGNCIIAETGLCKAVDRRMLTSSVTTKKRKLETGTTSKYFEATTDENSIKVEKIVEVKVKREKTIKQEVPFTDIEELVGGRTLRSGRSR